MFNHLADHQVFTLRGTRCTSSLLQQQPTPDPSYRKKDHHVSKLSELHNPYLSLASDYFVSLIETTTIWQARRQTAPNITLPRTATSTSTESPWPEPDFQQTTYRLAKKLLQLWSHICLPHHPDLKQSAPKQDITQMNVILLNCPTTEQELVSS